MRAKKSLFDVVFSYFHVDKETLRREDVMQKASPKAVAERWQQ